MSQALATVLNKSQSKVFWSIILLDIFWWLIMRLIASEHGFWVQPISPLKAIAIFSAIAIIIPKLCMLLARKSESTAMQHATNAIDIILKLTMVPLLLALSPTLLTTPFPLISHHLQQLDLAINFNQRNLMLWLFSHPRSLMTTFIVYKLLAATCGVVFFVSGYYNKVAAYRYLTIIQLGILFASIIFYFFPSTSPILFTISEIKAYGFHDAIVNILYSAKTDLVQLQHAHSGLNPAANNNYHYGFIAMPSLHIFFTITLFYLTKKCCPKLSVILFLNLAATTFAVLALGEHYLADIIAGGALFYICLHLTRAIDSESPSSATVK